MHIFQGIDIVEMLICQFTYLNSVDLMLLLLHPRTKQWYSFIHFLTAILSIRRGLIWNCEECFRTDITSTAYILLLSSIHDCIQCYSAEIPPPVHRGYAVMWEIGAICSAVGNLDCITDNSTEVHEIWISHRHVRYVCTGF